MTARDLYEYVLIELHKENAPNILLEDFNYFVNKAINQYVNKRYNIYDINQQTTDDLRVLKATAELKPEPLSNQEQVAGVKYFEGTINNPLKATYKVELPSDYLHMLNCICVYEVAEKYRCYDPGTTFYATATKLTADMWGQVVNNYWNKPTYRRPYYYIHNINGPELYDNIITQSHPKLVTDDNGNLVDNNGDKFADINDRNVITLNPSSIKDYQKEAGARYGNHSKVVCEIRYGTDNSTFVLKGVYIDYIKSPEFIRLTQSQVDKVIDESQVLEFPDYVCQEIVNELVHIIMENISDPRIQTHPVVSQSIANPAQQQTEPVAQQS